MGVVMPWYYVTVGEQKVWNIAVEAENEKEAEEKAIYQAAEEEPDYTNGPLIEFVEEAKRYVE